MFEYNDPERLKRLEIEASGLHSRHVLCCTSNLVSNAAGNPSHKVLGQRELMTVDTRPAQ